MTNINNFYTIFTQCLYYVYTVYIAYDVVYTNFNFPISIYFHLSPSISYLSLQIFIYLSYLSDVSRFIQIFLIYIISFVLFKLFTYLFASFVSFN